MNSTPRIAAWRKRVRASLDGYGHKAELARWLAQSYGREPRSWEKTIQDILARQIPNGELVLAIDHWLAQHK